MHVLTYLLGFLVDGKSENSACSDRIACSDLLPIQHYFIARIFITICKPINIFLLVGVKFG